ncbi:MAG TPA: MFS transporter [Gemmataceae bacterium]|nr:MFS transporter [Gemmataceae bacterium]
MTPARGPSWKWWVCGALLLATMLLYMDRLTLSVTATQLKAEIHLDDKRYGRLEECFSYAFALGGILFGLIADRVGPRRLYPFVLVGWSAAGLATPLASWPALVQVIGDPGKPGEGEFRWLLLCRTLLGLFEAGHWPCALITARNILSDEDRPLGNSILQSGASLGAVLTPIVIEAFRAFGSPWQLPFVVIGAIGILWVPLWVRLIGPEDVRVGASAPSAGREAPRVPVRYLLVQLLALATIVITIGLAWQIHRAWLPKYLKEVHLYSEATANYFTSAYYLVADVGCLASGALVSWLIARGMGVRGARLAAFAVCVGCAALSAVVPQIGRGPLLFGVLLLMGAGALGAHPQYYALVQDLPTRYMGVLSGVLAATSWVAVGRMQGALGAYIQETGSYDAGLVFVGLAPLAGLLAMGAWAIFSRPRRDQTI